MNLKQLKKKHARLLKEAEKFRKGDGTFENDEVRASFDAKMREVNAVASQIRDLEDDPEDDDLDDEPIDAVTTERERCIGIRKAIKAAKLDETFGNRLIDTGVSLADARGQIIDELAKRDEAKPRTEGGVPVVDVGEGRSEKFVRGVAAWLIQRSGLSGMVAKHQGITVDKLESAGEFRGLSLLEIGRNYLESAGVNTRGLSRMELAEKVLTFRSATQGTSDFTVALENAMNKVLLAAYAIQPDTWRTICKVGSVPDFRATPRYRRGSFGRLDNLNELGEFKNKGITDAEKVTNQASTVGNIVGLSRQALVNDDMGFFTDVLTAMGRAAKLSIEIDFYALLAQNSGAGPTMADTLALFHATHGNISTGAAIAAAAFDLDRVQMAQQKDKDGNDYLDLRPAILLLPVGLGGQARVINGSQYDPDTVANKAQMKPNIVVGLFRTIVDTPRLTGTRRYLFADPAIAPVFEVVFLDGQENPILESKEGWRTDGMEWRVRLDYGVGAIDYRGAVTNAGV